MNIDNILRVQPNFIQSYNSYIELGQEFLKSQKVAIVGLARNVELILKNNIIKIINCFSIAQDYRLFIFENDSTDNTKNILKTATETNEKIKFYTENYNRKQYGTTKEKERTQALAEYRNICVNWIHNNCADYDFIIVMDLDFFDFSINGCYNSFGWLKENNQIDGIAGNSFELKKIFNDKIDLWNYDSWAFRGTWWEDSMKYLGSIYDYNPMLWFGFWIPPIGSIPIKVNSAFGGMTIYRTGKFISGVYSGDDCEHVCFHYDLKQKTNFNLYLNPSQRMLV